MRTTVSGFLLLIMGFAHQTQSAKLGMPELFEKYQAGQLKNPLPPDQIYWQSQQADQGSLIAFVKQNRERLSAAAFLLEYSEAAYRAGKAIAPRAFDESLTMAQQGQAGSSFDHAWHELALALIEARGAGLDLGSVRAIDSRQSDLHVFPGDTRSAESSLDRIALRLDPSEVALARGLLRQQIALNQILMIRSLQAATGLEQEPVGGGAAPNDVSPKHTRDINMREEMRYLGAAIDLFREAEKGPSVRVEAMLRRAGTLAFLGQHEEALGGGPHREVLELFHEIESTATEPRWQYLCDFLEAQYLQSQGDLSGAEVKFGATSRLFTEAQSAKVGLANVQYLEGLPVPSEFYVSLRSTAPDLSDPWLGYRYGTYVNWASLVTRLRTTFEVAK